MEGGLYMCWLADPGNMKAAWLEFELKLLLSSGEWHHRGVTGEVWLPGWDHRPLKGGLELPPRGLPHWSSYMES